MASSHASSGCPQRPSRRRKPRRDPPGPAAPTSGRESWRGIGLRASRRPGCTRRGCRRAQRRQVVHPAVVAPRRAQPRPIGHAVIHSATETGPIAASRLDAWTDGLGRTPVPGAAITEPADSARQLFATLDRRVDAAELAGLRSSCRFDVAGAGSWRVLIANGSVHVSESHDPADTVITVSEDLLLQLARGDQNATTALLSGRVEIVGDLAVGERLTRALFHA